MPLSTLTLCRSFLGLTENTSFRWKRMSSLRTLSKVKANQLSPRLRERLGLDPRDKVSLTVEKLGEKSDPWPLIKGSLTRIEADALRSFMALSRRSRKAAPRV